MSVQRFTLDQSPLDDEAYGLDGSGFVFTTFGTGSTALGSLTATAQADVIVVIQSIGVAELGAITADAITSVAHFATGTASATTISAATSVVTGFAIGDASLGALGATSTAAVAQIASASASLGIISADATTTVTHIATAITTADLTATANATIGSVNAGFALLGGITATATATVTPSVMPVSGGGVRFIQPAPRPQLKPIIQPEPVKIQEPKLIIKPKPKPVRVVSSAASAEFGALTSSAFANISWIAELDDLEILELI